MVAKLRPTRPSTPQRVAPMNARPITCRPRDRGLSQHSLGACGLSERPLRERPREAVFTMGDGEEEYEVGEYFV